MWNFHIDDYQGKHRYNMILGCNTFLKINIDLCLSYNTIRDNGGAYKVYTAPTKDVLEINFNFTSSWIK